MSKSTRIEAFSAIDAERDYQEGKWTEGITAPRHTENDYLIYIEDYINEAKRVTTRRPDVEAKEFVLNTLRKIGAMAVAAMEQNGVRSRSTEGARPVGFAEV